MIATKNTIRIVCNANLNRLGVAALVNSREETADKKIITPKIMFDLIKTG